MYTGIVHEFASSHLGACLVAFDDDDDDDENTCNAP